MATSSCQTNLSRLDRVFTLLENGASAVTRKAAAKQLGDVQNKHPHELNNLLAKLLVYIHHNEWDTRIAAAEAMEAVVGQVPAWKPEPAEEKQEAVLSDDDHNHQLTFRKFDIDRVLNGSHLLLASSGDEYYIPVNTEGLNAKDRIKKQRRVLEKRLGLTFGDTSLGVASDDLFQDEDLVMTTPDVKVKQELKQDINKVMPQFEAKMSSRERNLAKRKAKLLLKQQSRDGHSQDGKSGDGQPSKRRKKEMREKYDKKEILPDDIPKHSPFMQDWTEWPFNWICDEMINMLFSPSWESRHGACLGLREIIKKHGGGSGKERRMHKQELLDANQSWLTDLSIRLLCVISLDRFADFVSDQVVAPVRESCAQTLSVVTSFMKERHVIDVVQVLLYLCTKEEWELRQSAMLALQYVIAVRKDLQHKLLPICFPCVIQGLNDKDGDVRSASAKTLMPTTDLLTRDSKYEHQLQALLNVLWNSLHEYDELTSSTQSVLLLLAKLIKALPLVKICQANRAEVLVSFLWPFFHHVIASVREAALSTLLSMLAGTKHQTFPWLSSVCVNGLWNLFQCCLLEPKPNLRDLALEAFLLLVERSPSDSILPCAFHVPSWLALACQPALVPYNPSQLIPSTVVSKKTEKNADDAHEKVIAGRQTNTHCEEEFDEYLMKTREMTTKMIGVLCNNAFRNLPNNVFTRQDSPIHQINHQLLLYMKSQSALQRIIAALVIGSWWENLSALPSCSSTELHCALSNLQNDFLYFSEVSVKFVQVQTDLKCLLTALQKLKISQEALEKKQMYMFGDVIEFCATVFPKVVPKSNTALYEQRDSLLKLVGESDAMQNMLDSRVKSSAACAIASAVHSTGNKHDLWKLPEKLNPIIRPLMECIKKENNATVRSSASFALSRLMGLCCKRDPCPNTKLIKNLCLSLCSSSVRAPTPSTVQEEFSDDTLKASGVSRDRLAQDGVVTQLRRYEASMAEINKKKRKADKKDQPAEPDTSTGAERCLQVICDMYGAHLFVIIPQLWEVVCVLQDSRVMENMDSYTGECASKIVQSVVALEVMAPAIQESVLQDQILSLLPRVMSLLWTKLAHLRFLSARCLARLAQHVTAKVMPLVLEKVRCNLDSSKDVYGRKGAIETVANIVDMMGTSVVPYAVLLVVPLLGSMSDHDQQVRLLATHCFAQLVQFMPVESSIPDPPNLPDSFVEQKKKERRFLEQLFNNKSLEAYQVPVQINATLRSYQEDGVKWLAFLNRYRLHGVLCDEMGLGKTLQTICMMASDHHYKKENPAEKPDLLSLVVCPPTLTGHWVDEVKKFCSDLHPLQYAGNPQERARIQAEVKKYNLIIASYEVVRNDIAFFNQFKWNYCVLDEGHAIRNGKSKTSQAIKSLVSNHRLILTGTPIQNSVLELWSLFDFLIPGFLGTEQEFNLRFTKPIVASRDSKSSSKEQEQGVLAMEALHRQVLPFMMRRMKEDVLKDLPPKIIQDYYCDLSPLQLELYEDFAKSRAKKNAESSITSVGDEIDQKSRMKGTSHVFQALQYLQKVCNHPSFVVTPTHPHFKSIMAKLASLNSNLHDIKHATKLTALKQLLLDCGIGAESLQEQSVVSQHRALVFCQHRNLLDIIAKDLFASIMPTVTFLRLDGGVPVNQRFSLVSRFNNDPSIDVLLLTTKVGGLGLNLTGADTVIFVEHDWNPMVDLQAMDRAHRIGQKKVVNVYRLITRGTLEEKILGLQKFKLSVANTVVGEDNRGLQSMGTSQVLELFTVNKASRSNTKKTNDGSSSKGLRAMMEDLGELWDQSQYDDEYNIDSFIQTLDDRD